MKKLLIMLLICLVMLQLVACKEEKEEALEPAAPEVAEQETKPDKVVEPEEVEVANETSLSVASLNNEQLNINDALFSDYAVKKKTPIWTFPELEAIGDWGTMPAPEISPMGAMSNYDELTYSEDADYTFSFIDHNQTVVSREVYGELWTGRVMKNYDLSNEENNQLALDYKDFLEPKNGEAYGMYYDEYTFYYDNGSHYWIAINDRSSQYFTFTIMKERRIVLNETVTIQTADYDENEIFFTIEIPDDKFISLIASLDTGFAEIDLEMDTIYGEYERETEINTDLDSEEGLLFVDDDYINEPGFANIRVSWSESNQPTTIEFTLESKYDVEPIVYGDQLGGISLASDHVKSISITPTLGDDLHITHPDYDKDSLYFDKNPENNYVTYVPAGYYEIEVSTIDGMVDKFKTLKVPVHTGKITEVIIPQSVTDAIKNSDATEEKGIFISDVIEDDQKVSFVFSMVDSATNIVSPSIDNSIIYEGGAVVDILSIEPVITPLNIVVLLDSSGSMKGQMDQTVEAAKTFIKGLPDKTNLTLVDFDSTPKVFKGQTIDALISELDSVKAKGATALYDSVILGLDVLNGEDRAALVVFTDGEDANLNDTARGSIASLEEALSSIDASDVPLYTIGFGEGHDSATLETFAMNSLGKYYSADDQTALTAVFESINVKLGNTYIATYQRPTMSSISDVPVVSLVIDVSGSMYSDFYKVSGFRLDDVKALYHDFLQDLPDETQIMVTAFNDEIHVTQGLTTDRVLALNAIGNLEHGGGTDILGSVTYGYEALKKVASSKKIMIYLTDAALSVDEDDESSFFNTLEDIKNDDIQTLWVGMGIEDDSDFKNVAELAGGDYVVSEDHQTLSAKFDIILNSAKTAVVSDDTSISLNIKKRTEEGAFDSFSTTILHPLSPVKRSDVFIIQDTIKYQLSEMQHVKQYDALTSQYISGDSVPAETTIITKRIPTDATGENTAARIHIEEIIFSNKLAGVEAPRNQRFMAVLMDMTHILPEQEVVVYPDGSGHPSNWVGGGNNSKGVVKTAKIPYAIPSFISHFGMSYNGDGPYPSATATWLAYEPIVVPGTYDITLYPDESKKGMMVFIVPDAPLEQLGIHFYDDDYGFMDIPIVGVIPKRETTFGQVKGQATKLGDNFTLEVTGYTTEHVLDEPIETSQHRAITGNFDSDVKAVIKVDPSEAMYMKFGTANGDLYSPLSKTTSSTPFGFFFPQAITPGARNPVRMLFQMPEALEANESTLFLDLKDEDMNVSVSDGSLLSATIIDSFDTEYFTADINDVFTLDQRIVTMNWTWIVVDVTIHDKKDGFATRGATNNFYCDFPTNGEAKEVAESTSLSGFAASNTYGYGSESRLLNRLGNTIELSEYTSDLLLGMDEEAIVYDGTSRRGLMLFSIARKDIDQAWTLEFDETDFKLTVNDAPQMNYDDLFTMKETIEFDNRYGERLSAALPKAIQDYKLRHPEALRTKVVSDEPLDEINMPSASAHGYNLVSQIQTISDLTNTIRSLRYVNNGLSTKFNYTFSKEALLTQGFGTEGDMANLTIEVLSRLGYKTKRTMVSVTEKGKEFLSAMSGLNCNQVNSLPAVTYYDDAGTRNVMVLPFGRDIQALEGLVFYEGNTDSDYESPTERLYIYYDVLPTEEGHLAQLNSMAGALGGSSSEVSISRENMMSISMPLATFSKDAVDIGTSIIGNKAYPVVYTADGPIMGEDYIDLNYYGIRGMGFELDAKEHHVVITEDMEANQVFMTLAYNLPEIPTEAASLITDLMDGKKDLSPDTFSALKWLHRRSLYSFIASQTIFERALDADYDLITGRIYNPRLIIVQSVMGNELTMSMDLLYIQNDLHSGEDDVKRSYRLMSGITASQLESKALIDGKGFEEFWDLMPQDGNLVLFDSNDLESHKEFMINAGMTDEMIAYFEDLDRMVIIQSAPSIIDGKERWAWLEIDDFTYETISVLDTFEHGSMTSNATLNSALEKAQYVIGAFKGVETSVWGVGTMSLELTNYEDILANAKSFVLQIGKNFEVDIGPFNLAAGKAPDLGGNYKKLLEHFKGGKKEADSKGFKEGYKDGVELYFKLAE